MAVSSDALRALGGRRRRGRIDGLVEMENRRIETSQLTTLTARARKPRRRPLNPAVQGGSTRPARPRRRRR